MNRINGKCLCGSVVFETPKPEHIDACHCTMCQNWVGGPFIAADFKNGGIIFTKDEGLSWYESSDWAKRGFCHKCGTSLFYCLKGHSDYWAIAAGALDLPKGLKLYKEIFIDDKPDYYALSGNHLRLTGEQVWAQIKAGKYDG